VTSAALTVAGSVDAAAAAGSAHAASVAADSM